MNNKFLQFNGKNIVFVADNGQYWVAIKPICDALNVAFNKQYEKIKSDPILKDVYTLRYMHDTIKRTQKMLVLPEMYIYGWLFGIQSASEALLKYKWECYRILYNHFRGSLVERHLTIEEKADMHASIYEIEKRLENNPDYIALKNARNNISKLNRKLADMDKREVEKQLLLWN